MYFGNVLMLVGTPPALGSYWALLFVAPGVLVLVSRIRDEEKLLRDELAGYCAYSRRVRYRLVPCLW
jgi:protein-S-isoprenylcysteine O-methyltransferase Ste14